MKKIIGYLAYFCCMGMLVACSDDFLTVKPLSIYTPQSTFVDASGFEGVLVTLRKNLRPDFYGDNPGIATEAVTSDLAVNANKQQGALHNFDTQILPTGTGDNNMFEIWERAYNQVRNANVILARIDLGTFDSKDSKNAIIAEAYFHRSYWFYRLVHLFGDVPFLNKEHVEPKIDFYTHSRETILEKIAEDMEFAVLWLPDDVVPGAISKGAGYHLLTKIYLSCNRFSDAAEAATKVIGGGKYALMKNRFGTVSGNNDYNVIWDLHQKENKSLSQNTEGIVVVQDRYGFPDANVTNGTYSMRRYVPSWFQTYIKDPDGKNGMADRQNDPLVLKIGRGVAYVRAGNYHNYEIWQNCGNDLRHDEKINWFPVDSFWYNNPSSKYYRQRVQIKYTNPNDLIHCWYPFPLYKVYVSDENRPTQPWGGHSDWYLFRLAETYLLRAEAYYWLNDLANAAADINEVRLRAKAPSITASDVTLDYILDERARELFAEEFRKTELTRIAYIMAKKGLNGYSMDNFSQKNFWYDRVMAKNEYYKAGNIMWGANIYKISPFHVLWPVPADAINSNVGGVVNQNSGYIGYDKKIDPLTVIDDSQ